MRSPQRGQTTYSLHARVAPLLLFGPAGFERAVGLSDGKPWWLRRCLAITVRNWTVKEGTRHVSYARRHRTSVHMTAETVSWYIEFCSTQALSLQNFVSRHLDYNGIDDLIQSRSELDTMNLDEHLSLVRHRTNKCAPCETSGPNNDTPKLDCYCLPRMPSLGTPVNTRTSPRNV